MIKVDHHWLWKVSRVVLALALLVILVSPIIPMASAQSDPQEGISEERWAKMPTPTRIDSAFERGIIDAETHVLYLAYAVYDHQSLPEAYISKVGWFGTHVVAEVNTAYNEIKVLRAQGDKSVSAQVVAELDRVLTPAAATYCDREDGANTIESAHFAVTYDTIGAGLDINAYTTSMENKAYTPLITNYGWAQPPICGETGVDCSGAAPPNNKFPLLITDLGGGLFGYVTTNQGDGLWAGFVPGNNPHTALAETDARTSCMVLNSNFGEPNFAVTPPNNTAQENLDGTTSHEFVHAIQNAWGDPGEQMAAMWAESTAAYFEDEGDDAGNTQYVYLYGDFNKNSLKDWGAGSEGQKDYENLVFFRYIAEQYGGANSSSGGEKVIQKFFENVATNTPAVDQELASFKMAVESFALGGGAGSSVFADVFHNYAIAAKFMKDCQDEAGYGSAYCYEEGSEYRATSRNFQEAGNVPAVAGNIASTTGSITGTVKSDYGVNWVRLPAKGNSAYKIDLTATTTTELKASVVCDTGSAFTIAAFPQLITDTTAQSVTSFDPATCNDVVLVITNQMESASGATSVAHGYTVQLGAIASLDTHIYLPLITRTQTTQ